MECVDCCEFQKFDGKKFKCSLYDEKELKCYKENGNVSVIRCGKCIEETIEYTLKRRENELNRMAQNKENGE